MRTAHGTLPVPPPAVLEILRSAGAPARGGPVEAELCTPTGAAIVAAAAGGYGALPAMRIRAVGIGAGDRDLPDRPNVVRLVLGEPAGGGAGSGDPGSTAFVLETNVDDLDLRAWPGVLEALLAAGASDAWLAPILMKKGRPAHTLSVLVPGGSRGAVRDVIYRETTTLGVRETPVGKNELQRDWVTVTVAGEPVRIKVGRWPDGRVVNAMPEWEDVVRAAARAGRPVKQLLAEATGRAAALTEPG